MGNEWGEAFRERDASKSEAELWEERRLAHWEQMRAAWERWDALVKAYKAQGFTGRNPYS